MWQHIFDNCCGKSLDKFVNWSCPTLRVHPGNHKEKSPLDLNLLVECPVQILPHCAHLHGSHKTHSTSESGAETFRKRYNVTSQASPDSPDPWHVCEASTIYLTRHGPRLPGK